MTATLFAQLDPDFSRSASASGYRGLHRDIFLQEMRYAFWVNAATLTGQPHAHIIQFCKSRARDFMRKEKRAELIPLEQWQATPVSRRTERVREGVGGEMAACTITHPDQLEAADLPATLNNLAQRGLLTRAAANEVAVELSRLDDGLRGLAAAVLSSFSRRELVKAGYSRRRVEEVRDLIAGWL